MHALPGAGAEAESVVDASVNPWVHALPGAGLEAESIVLRGVRRNGAPVSTSQAAAALDASLLQEGTGSAMVCFAALLIVNGNQ